MLAVPDRGGHFFQVRKRGAEPMPQKVLSEPAKGVLAMLGACTVWGLSPIYYKLLADVPPLEVLSHRTLWSFVTFALVLLAQKRLGEFLVLLANRRNMLLVLFAGLMISLNWFVFILSIQIDRAVEASLGYYIFPLVAVVLGILVFGERPLRLQLLAVGLAVAAVLVLTMGLGAAPWISLILAGSFGTYGVIKKFLSAGPVVSVTAEVTVLLPLALVWLFGVHFWGWSGFDGRVGGVFGHDALETLLLVLAGGITAGPLVLFSYAARRLRLGTIGVIQYLNPTLQFLIATLLFAEPFTGWHALAFSLIWLALVLYSLSGWRQEKSLRRAAASAGTPSSTVI